MKIWSAIILVSTKSLVACVLLLAYAATAGCTSAGQTNATAKSAYSNKIAPALIAATDQLRSGKVAAPLTGLVRSDVQGRIQVYVYVSSTTVEVTAALKTQGLQDQVVSPALHVVQGWVLPQNLEALAALPFVTRITPPHYAQPH